MNVTARAGCLVCFSVLASSGCGGSSLGNVVPEAGMGGVAGSGGAAGKGGSGGGTGGGARDAGSNGGMADAGEASVDASRDVDNSCQFVQCFRAINCVTRCGGPILSSGCCPCAAPAFDSVQCRDGSPTMR